MVDQSLALLVMVCNINLADFQSVAVFNGTFGAASCTL
jgi:hypothetical protein